MANVFLTSGTGNNVDCASNRSIYTSASSFHTTFEQSYADLSTAELQMDTANLALLFVGQALGYRKLSLAVYDEQQGPDNFYTLEVGTGSPIEVYPIVSPLNANVRSVFLHNVPLPGTGSVTMRFDTTLFTLAGKMVVKAYLST